MTSDQNALAPTGTYASWGRRVSARVLDQLLYVPAWVIAVPIAVATGHPATTAAGEPTTDPGPLGIALLLLAGAVTIGLWVWNRGILDGGTGSSLGKRAVGTRLTSVSTGQPIGVGMGLVRDIAHVVDSVLYLGYLWPIWDVRRQTFADKIVGCVVTRRR